MTASGRIVFDDVSVTYHGRLTTVAAVEDVSLTVARSEVVAFIGPSGSGKTTLLNVIAGLVVPTRGSASVGGEPPTAYRRSHSIGFCFQQPVLFEWRSVLENVLLPVDVRKMDRAAARERALRLLERVGIQMFKDAAPSELSGGMQQRVNLCRAMILDPEILLLDEPFSAVDELTRLALWMDMRRLRTERMPTTCIVTHSVDEAAFLADRVFVLDRSPGRVRACIPIALGEDRSADTLLTEAFHRATVSLRRALAP